MDGAFVGRTDELSVLLRAFETAAPTRIVSIEGTAGIGKTTLLRQALAASLLPPSTVVTVAPTSAERQTAWGAVRLLLTGGLAGLATELGETIGAAVLSVTGLAVESTRRGGAIDRPTETPAEMPTDSQAAFAFADLVSRLQQHAPLLIVLEDSQWIDAASSAALTIAIRTGGRWAVTRRTGERSFLDVRRVCTADELVSVELSPMDTHDLDLLARVETGRRWNSVEVSRLLELSGGNPLHARERVRAYSGPGDIARSSGVTSLEDLFGERIETLSNEEFEVLALLALMSRPDLGALLQLVHGATAEAALSTAEQLGLLHVSTNSCEFDHALTRRAVIGRVGGIQRARLHRRLADVAEHPVERAWHLGQGALGPDPSIADVLEEAGVSMYDRGDSAPAADMLARSFELTPPSEPLHRRRRACRAGTAAADAGDWSRAHELLVDVVATAGDSPAAIAGRNSYVVAVNRLYGAKPTLDAIDALLPVVTDSFERAELLAKSVRITMFNDLEDANELAVRALEHAESTGIGRLIIGARLGLDQIRLLRGFAVNPAPFLVDRSKMTYAEIGYTARACLEEITDFLDMHDIARELCTETYEVGIATGSTADVHNALNRLVGIERRCGNWSRSKEMADQFVSLVSGHNDELPGQQSIEQLWHMAATGDHARVAQWVPAVVSEAEASFPIGRFPILCDAGFALFAIGDLSGAVDLFRAAQATADGMHLRDVRSADYHVNLVEALLLLGNFEEAAPVAADLEAIAARGDSSFAAFEAARARALVLASSGLYDKALDVLRQALDGADALHRPFEHARGLLQLGGVLRRLGVRAQAREVLDRSAAIFEGLGAVPWITRVAAERELLGQRSRASDDPSALSAAEEQVVNLALAGRSNQAIAAELFVSVRTVESHLTRSYRKLEVKSRSELLARSRTSS